MILWAVDPGQRLHAVAEFLDGVFAGAEMRPMVAGPRYRPDQVICEVPEVYPGQTKGTKDLMALRGRVGGIEEWCHYQRIPLVGVLPRRWKSQQPKPVHHWRIWTVLKAHEQQTFGRCVGRTGIDVEEYIHRACTTLAQTGKVAGYSRRDHNLLDATGLGLWALKRIDANGRPL